MPDRINYILTQYLDLEHKSLRELMKKTLTLCQVVDGPRQAVEMLEAKRIKFTSTVDFLKNVSYCCLFLAYACHKNNDNQQALKWARIAIDEFDKLNHVRNRAVARWVCALIYQIEVDVDEAERYFEAALRILEQEVLDHKRRSFYEKAKECKRICAQLRKDAGLPQEDEADQSLSYEPDPSKYVPVLPSAADPEETEETYYQDLLQKTGGDREAVERMIAYESERSPGANRIECMRAAKERWEKDNR